VLFDGGHSSISIISIGELRAGVEMAGNAEVRSARRVRLEMVEEAFEPVPVDESVAIEYGRLLALARKERRSEKATDLLIAATAGSSGRTLWTRDGSQASMAEAANIPVKLV
jgi:predicted nucleic acid-binding protein